MVAALELLSRLRKQGIQVWAEGERLRYRAPTGSMSPDLRAELSEHKAALLRLLQQADTPVQPDLVLPPVTPQPRTGPVPMAPGQEPLWFLEHLGVGSAYTIPLTVRLSGRLDGAALERSLNAVIARHELLRTTFAPLPGSAATPTAAQTVRQVIAPSWQLRLAVDDLRTHADSERESAVAQQLTAMTQQPFDLAQGPLLRVRLFLLTNESAVLAMVFHHIIADGWSVSLFIEELATCYRAASAHPALSSAELASLPDLPTLPVQYADYALWQQQLVQDERLHPLRTFWQRYLDGMPALLTLSTDRPRPPQQSMRGASLPWRLEDGMQEQVRALSQQSGSTPFMVLLTAYAVLLLRYSGETDLVIGTPVAGRPRSELEHLIGYFVNMLLVRVRIDDNPTFGELLERVRDSALEAYAHQEMPFAHLLELMQPERTLSYQALFQVVFAYNNTPLPPMHLPDLVLERQWQPTGGAQVDLALFVDELPDGVVGQWEYATDLFDQATIERMSQHYDSLLKSMLTNPDQPVHTAPLLTAAERQRILFDWNATAAAYSRDTCLHHLFEQQARRTPDAVALVFEDAQLTYADLDRRANQLAHHLRGLGVGPEVLVALCVERSLDMVIGLLGILKAGGAYVPLDPSYPAERLAFMLEDSQAPVLLTQERLQGMLPRHHAEVVSLDGDWPTIAEQPTTAPAVPVVADNLAYVIYTSGSTGRPKGVMIEHRNVVNFLTTMQQYPGMQPQDVLLAVTTLSFDIAVLELFLPLTTGGCMVLVGRDTAQDGQALAAALQRYSITCMQATPATWRLLLETGWQGKPDLKIICGGEALPWDLAQQLLARGQELWNMYGPTETTIWSTILLVRPDTERITLGRPVANTQVYLLDAHMQPVPLGVAGELYIGGDGVARGYLNRPDLTDERFIPNPFGTGRLYQTGDLARYRPDGTIEFLGRADFQVKVRGFRIELGEIEAVLSQHPDVQQAVVVAREPTPGDTQLVAYVVGSMNGDPAALRDYLQQRLPTYMLPTAFVVLDTLPLTPNGKVDRQALPSPVFATAGAHPDTAPRTPLQRLLCMVWRAVLEPQHISIHANFFHLGGHSLKLMQVLNRLHKVRLRVTLSDLFAYQTVAALAAALEQREGRDRVQKKAQLALEVMKMPPDEVQFLVQFAPARKELLHTIAEITEEE